MPSWQSRLILGLIRNRHLFSLRLTGERYDQNTSVSRLRNQADKFSQRFKAPKGVNLIPTRLADQPGLWVRPEETNSQDVILYFHGGGYVMGSVQSHGVHVAKVVKGSGIASLLFDYRLAPEHPFPAALEDALRAYVWLLESGTPADRIMFMGDSAGGGLCLATLLVLKDRALALPKAAVALSPWTDLTLSGESHRSKAAVCLAPPGSAEFFSRAYLGDHNPRHPWISPLFGELDGLPPLLLMVGEDETLRDDTIRFAEKAQAAGVKVIVRVAPGMVHCYPLLSPLFPEAKEAMAEICRFLNSQLEA